MCEFKYYYANAYEPAVAWKRRDEISRMIPFLLPAHGIPEHLREQNHMCGAYT